MQTLVSCHTFTTKKRYLLFVPATLSGGESQDVFPCTEGALAGITAIGPASLGQGWPNFQSLWATDLNHHTTQSHDNVSPTDLWTWREMLQSSPLVQNNSFSGSSVACPQNGFGLNVLWVPGQPQSGVVSAVYDSTCVRSPSQGSARPAAPTSAPGHHP